MSQKPDISATVNTFFQLWQRQVTLLAQSPESGADELMAQSRRISERLKSESEDLPIPDGDKSP